MSSKKISELPLLGNIDLLDYIQIIDESEGDLSLKNKRVLISTLKAALVDLYDGYDTKANIEALDPALHVDSVFWATDTKLAMQSIQSAESVDGVKYWQEVGVNYDPSIDSHELPTNKCGVTLQIGKEFIADLINTDATPITELNPQVVKAVGSDVADNFLSVSRVKASDVTDGDLVYITTSDLSASTGKGCGTYLGYINGIDASGAAVSESWDVGDILYIHPVTVGALTKVRPVIDARPIAVVRNNSNTVGKLYVTIGGSQKLNDDVNIVGISRVYLTAEEETPDAITFYQLQTETTGIPSGTITATVLGADETAIFNQDFVSIVFPTDGKLDGTTRTGVLEYLINNANGNERLHVELYEADGNGVPLDSGLTHNYDYLNGIGVGGKGTFGVAPVLIYHTSLLSSDINVPLTEEISGLLANDYFIPAGNRLVLRVLAEKVGGSGTDKIFTVNIGQGALSYINSFTTFVDGNGTTANDNKIDLGGVLNQDTTIQGASKNLAFGTSASKTKEFRSVAEGKTIIANNGTSAATNKMRFYSLSEDGNENSGISLQSGTTDTDPNYEGLNFVPHTGIIELYAIDKNPSTPSCVLQLYPEGTAGYTLGLYEGTGVSWRGFFAESSRWKFYDTITNRGLNYSGAADYSSINWATDDNHIPSIGMIKANTVGADYSNTVSRFTFKSVVSEPVSPVPSGEMHFDTNTSILYLSINDLDSLRNHQIIIGKMDGVNGVDLIMTTGQWDGVTDNFSFGSITSDYGINDPNFVKIEADWGTLPSIFSDNDEINVTLSTTKKALTNGSGTTANGTAVDLGGDTVGEVTIKPGTNFSDTFNIGTSDWVNGFYDSINAIAAKNVYLESNIVGDYSKAYASVHIDGNRSSGTKSRVNIFASNEGGTASSNMNINSEGLTLDTSDPAYVYGGNTLKANLDLQQGIIKQELRTNQPDEVSHFLMAVTGFEVRDDLANVGLREYADYSANYNDLNLVNHGYVKRSKSKTEFVKSASESTLTINSDEKETAILTAQAVALTIAAPTGTPTEGQTLKIRIKDNGTARAITFNAVFKGLGVTLPTTTTANKTLYLGMMYNADSLTWDVIALNEEA